MLRSARSNTQFDAILIGSAPPSPSNHSANSSDSFALIEDKSDLFNDDVESTDSDNQSITSNDSNVIDETEYSEDEELAKGPIYVSSDSEEDEDDDGDEEPSEDKYHMIHDMIDSGLTGFLDPIIGEQSAARKPAALSIQSSTQSYGSGLLTQSNDSDADDEEDPLDTFMDNLPPPNHNSSTQFNDSRPPFSRAHPSNKRAGHVGGEDEDDDGRESKRARYNQEPVSNYKWLRWHERLKPILADCN